MHMKILAAVGMMAAFAQSGTAGENPRVLVAYFSLTNNTRTVAERIHARTGGDLFRVEPAQPYPEAYRETTRVARAELDSDARPALAADVTPDAMRGYDVVFLGYPCWWGTMPMALFTFLEGHDLAGKTIVPFCTHGGSGLARGPADIARLAPGATVRQGLAVMGDRAGESQGEVDGWLRRLGSIQ